MKKKNEEWNEYEHVGVWMVPQGVYLFQLWEKNADCSELDKIRNKINELERQYTKELNRLKKLHLNK